MTGLTEPNVISGLRGLEEKGLIIKIKDGGVNQYTLSIQEPEEAPIATIGADNQTPIATIGRTIKETVNERNDNNNQSPLAPDTQGAYTLFNLLGDEAKAKGHSSPKQFPSLLCKQKFEAAELRLGEIELEKAIRKAIEQNILSISGISNYITKWSDNQSKPQAPPFPPIPRPENMYDDMETIRKEARQRIDKAMKGK